MSFSEIRPYIKARLATTLPESTEHRDAFNFGNIPETILNKTYHIEFGEATFIEQNQTGLKYNYPVVLRIWFKGYLKPVEAVDTANIIGQAVLSEMLKHSNRLTQPGIKNITPGSFRVSPLTAKNDNTVELAIGLSFFILIDIN